MTVSALLDTVQSRKEDENYQLMNDCDIEFTAPEEIEIIDRNRTKKEEKFGKNIQSHGNAAFLKTLEKTAFLILAFLTNSIKVFQLLVSMKKLLILMF